MNGTRVQNDEFIVHVAEACPRVQTRTSFIMLVLMVRRWRNHPMACRSITSKAVISRVNASLSFYLSHDAHKTLGETRGATWIGVSRQSRVLSISEPCTYPMHGKSHDQTKKKGGDPRPAY